MSNRRRIGLGLAAALVLAASCGRRTLNNDAGMEGLGGASFTGVGGGSGAGGIAGGRGGAGGFAGTFGPGTGGTFGPGTGGTFGPGTGGTFGPGTGGTFGPGTGGTVFTGRGGTVGTGGTGMGGAVGRGGTGGTGGVAGRGGIGGTGGMGGMAGIGGTFNTGRGGTSDLAGRGGLGGRAGIGGTVGPAGMGAIGGVSGIGGTAGRGGAGGISGTGGGPCLTCRTLTLPIDAQDLVYNPARNELYASVQGAAAAYSNTIVVIDPANAAVTAAIPIGSNPGALALSDDGSTLWVAIEGAHAIRKMTTGGWQRGPLIHLPKVPGNPYAYFDATSMAVLPGAPQSVVVAESNGYSTIQVQVFDDGVPRPTAATNLYGSSFYRTTVIAGPPGTAFGLDGGTSQLYVFTISPSGITATQSSAGVTRDNWRDSLVYLSNRVFAGGGVDVVDVTNPALPVWKSRLLYPGQLAARDPMTLLALTVVPVTSPGVERTDIRIFSSDTLAESPTVSLQDSPGATYPRLVYAGGDAAAFIKRGGSIGDLPSSVNIVHHPALGTPIGGTGGAGGMGGDGTGGGGAGGGGGGMSGAGGGAPDPCPGCTATTIDAYGRDMVYDPTRSLIYVASDTMATLHPSTLVTVDPTNALVTSFIPVGNDPQVVALSDDASTLWLGLVGERRVRRLTPGATPVNGPVYSLPNLLTSGELAVPMSIVVLPGAPSSIAVGVYGIGAYGRRGVYILDDGQPRPNFIQPPEVSAYFLTNGAPGYLLGFGDNNNLVEFHIGAIGATMESFIGPFANSYSLTGFVFSVNTIYANTGEAIDLTNPDAPTIDGRFPAGAPNCQLAMRSLSRLMMLCPTYDGGPTLDMLDTSNFVRVGTVTLPIGPPGASWAKMIYLGGDAVAVLGYQTALEIVRAPLIGSQP